MHLLVQETVNTFQLGSSFLGSILELDYVHKTLEELLAFFGPANNHELLPFSCK